MNIRKMNIRKIKSLMTVLFLMAIIIFFSACDDVLKSLDENPPHIITADDVFKDLNGFELGLNGLYSLVRVEREGIDGSTALVAQMAMNGTDNMVTNHRVSGFATIAEDWRTNNPEDEYYRQIFLWLYSIINTSNNIITYAESDDVDLTENDRNRLTAEARAIRAWAYRHLTYGWGDVPLSLLPSSGTTIKTDWSRTPVAEVRGQMIKDLLFAEKYISVNGSKPGRITKGAVQHYLSELYLVLAKPDSALHWANACIDTPEYQLITSRYGVKRNQPGVPFMDMFYDGNSNREEGNTEALWVFQFSLNIGGGTVPYLRRDHHSRYVSISIGGVSPLQLTVDRGGQGFGRMSLTKWAIDNYEPQDDRASNYAIRKFFILKNASENAPFPADRLPSGYAYGDTIKLNWANDISVTSRNRVNWPFSRKADHADPTNVVRSPAFNDQVYLRLAETYLLKAEAQYLLGRPGDAAETINIIRRRSNASDITQADVNIDFILDERSRELVLEEQRRYTLLRTGKLMERITAYNKNGGQFFTQRDLLFPIPQTVIDANLTLIMPQNPGY